MPGLEISSEVHALLEERGIRIEDLKSVIQVAEAERRYHLRQGTGHRLAHLRPQRVTFWVEYLEEEAGRYKVICAYSHRMQILEGYNMASKAVNTNTDWSCAKCDRLLETATIKLIYLDETFAADTPACPECQNVFISEKDAVTRMALAEKMLEDK